MSDENSKHPEDKPDIGGYSIDDLPPESQYALRMGQMNHPFDYKQAQQKFFADFPSMQGKVIFYDLSKTDVKDAMRDYTTKAIKTLINDMPDKDIEQVISVAEKVLKKKLFDNKEGRPFFALSAPKIAHSTMSKILGGDSIQNIPSAVFFKPQEQLPLSYLRVTRGRLYASQGENEDISDIMTMPFEMADNYKLHDYIFNHEVGHIVTHHYMAENDMFEELADTHFGECAADGYALARKTHFAHMIAHVRDYSTLSSGITSHLTSPVVMKMKEMRINKELDNLSPSDCVALAVKTSKENHYTADEQHNISVGCKNTIQRTKAQKMDFFDALEQEIRATESPAFYDFALHAMEDVYPFINCISTQSKTAEEFTKKTDAIKAAKPRPKNEPERPLHARFADEAKGRIKQGIGKLFSGKKKPKGPSKGLFG